MDLSKLIGRAQNILTRPKAEWPVIGLEPTPAAGISDLYKNYIAVLAAVPAVAFFVKGSVIGYGAFGITVRTPIAAGVVGMVVSYALTLGLAYVMARIVDALAPSFGGQKSLPQALKTVVYAWTASWVAAIGAIVPWLGFLIALAGAVYSVYLFYLGLPHTMKCPPDRAVGYAAVSIVIAIGLSWGIGIVVVGVTGAGALMAGMGGGVSLGGSSDVRIEKDGPLGKLQAWSETVEAAGKRMEAAQRSGNANAQGEAMRILVGAALNGGDQVEALAPGVLRPFVPEALAGLQRTELSAERNGAMGVQVSNARASYGDRMGRSLRLEITDMGTAKGVMALAGWAGLEEDSQTDHGYQKTYKLDGRLVREHWDSQSRRGEYAIILGDRFEVKISGQADSIDQIKRALGNVNLAGLESLKDHGVTKG
jgi:hypothetical protein